MVPVVARRLSSVLARRVMTVSELAQQTGERQQTIDLIARGVSKRCRRFRLEKIAAVLEVPAEWLSGELDKLPFAMPRWASAADRTHDLSLGELERSSFLTECRRALERDFDSDFLNATDKQRRQWRSKLLDAFSTLVNPGVWRIALLRSETDMAAEEEGVGEAMALLAKGFEVAMTPWLKGNATLNIRAVVDQLEFQERWLQKYLEDKAARGLQKLIQRRDEAFSQPAKETRKRKSPRRRK
jgi:DNA-binding Xre family transcriptional regulator